MRLGRTLKEHLGYLLKKAYRFQNMEICYSNLDFVLEEVKKGSSGISVGSRCLLTQGFDDLSAPSSSYAAYARTQSRPPLYALGLDSSESPSR